MREVESKSPHKETGESDLGNLAVLLWRFKFFIASFVCAATGMGVLYALIATPLYFSEATITLKESGKSGDMSRIFTQLGGMGGMVASQLGMGNTTLDKIEITLTGFDLAERVITRNNLLPVLFPDMWNPKDSAWKPMAAGDVPNIRTGIKLLREEVISVSLDIKKNVIRIGALLPDPELAKKMVDLYLIELNSKIRNDVVGDAEQNRLYLERQLQNTMDPTLREKIQSMIGFEIEKSMLVSSQAFEVLEKPVVPIESSKPKRAFIVVVFLLIGLISGVLVVFVRNAVMEMKSAALDQG